MSEHEEQPSMAKAHYSTAEISYLRQNYPTHTPHDVIAAAMKRSPEAIKKKAQNLGLSRPKPLSPLAWLDAPIRDLYPSGGSQAVLAVVKSTPRTVRHRASVIGVQRAKTAKAMHRREAIATKIAAIAMRETYARAAERYGLSRNQVAGLVRDFRDSVVL